MNIKRKILAGLLFLFSLSALITCIAAYNTLKLANDSEAILKDNYNSVVYAKNMLKDISFPIDVASFEIALKAQQKNITEKGEKELTDSISNKFLQLKNDPKKASNALHPLLFQLMELNMKAIEQKNEQAQNTAHNVFVYLIITGLLFVVVAFIFIIKFPAYIAVPIIKRDIDKTNFIATVSHELKTPIASIKLSTKLLEDERIGNLNQEQKQLIQNIKEETVRVLKITTEVLSMAQMESGKIQLNIHPAEPKKIVDYAVEATHFQAEQKQIILEIKYDDQLPVINADVEKTAWVIVNLLSNAIRYSTEKSKIIIEVMSTAETVVFSVQDFGKGIEEKYLNKIFDRYFQVPGSKAGTGLGLAISKQFIEAQEGRIWAESAIGSGSKFTFILKRNFLNELSF
jgi:signal transduction histidine kinase